MMNERNNAKTDNESDKLRQIKETFMSHIDQAGLDLHEENFIIQALIQEIRERRAKSLDRHSALVEQLRSSEEHMMSILKNIQDGH